MLRARHRVQFADAAIYTPELLGALYAHMEWADATVWSEVLRTAGARDDPWLRDKLIHMHDAQQAFLSLWTGQPRQTPGDLGPLAAVCEWARPYYATARGFLEASDAPALAEPASDAFGERMRRHFGPPRGNVTLGDTALQVAAHTTHHRAQVMTRLRELGGAPPLVDYVVWVWWGSPAATWDRLPGQPS